MADERNGFMSWLQSQFRNPFSQSSMGRNIGMGIGALFGQPMLGGALGNMIGRGGLSGPMGLFSNSGPLVMSGRGLVSSIGRMNDSDPSTGFFNNPTAAWNWGKPPSNVPSGHPDFIGPMQYGGISASPDGTYGVNQGDQGSKPPSQTPNMDGSWGLGWTQGLNNQNNNQQNNSGLKPNQSGWSIGANGRTSFQGTGREITNLAGQLFNSRAPSHWRRTGTSGSWGSEGGGIDGFAVFANDRGEIQRNNFIR